jgi:hypothetical protein
MSNVLLVIYAIIVATFMQKMNTWRCFEDNRHILGRICLAVVTCLSSDIGQAIYSSHGIISVHDAFAADDVVWYNLSLQRT